MVHQDKSTKSFPLALFPPEACIPTLREAARVLGKNNITVVAVEGMVKDWAAYCETPSSRERFDTAGVGTLSQLTFTEGCRILQRTIAEYGQKLLQEEAEILFPEWAEYLAWRK